MRIIDPDRTAAIVEPVFLALYRVGALAAWTAALFFRRNMDAEWTVLRASGIIPSGPTAAPESAVDWFALLQQHPLPGLVLLNFVDLLNYALLAVIFLAAAAALRKTQPFLSLFTGLAALAGTLGYFLTNRALVLLALSREYAAAFSDLQRAALLAAGETALSLQRSNSYNGSGLYPSFLLVTLSGLALSVALLHSNRLGRPAAWLGLAANTCAAAYYLALAVAPALTFLPLSLSAVFLLAWYLVLGRRLWSLASQSAENRQPAIPAVPTPAREMPIL